MALSPYFPPFLLCIVLLQLAFYRGWRLAKLTLLHDASPDLLLSNVLSQPCINHNFQPSISDWLPCYIQDVRHTILSQRDDNILLILHQLNLFVFFQTNLLLYLLILTPCINRIIIITYLYIKVKIEEKEIMYTSIIIVLVLALSFF